MNDFRTWYGMQPVALRTLIAINVAFYVPWILLLAHLDATASFVFNHVALDPALPDLLFQPWQVITYNFVHLGTSFWGGFLHILFNMLWLYWIGKEYEELHGPQTLTAVYLIGGVGGALLSVLMFPLFPADVIHGASASVLAVITAVAIQYPYKKIALILLPPIRLIYLVLAFLVLDLLFARGTAVPAHLGGALFGFLFVRAEQRGFDLSSWTGIFFGGRRTRRTARATGSSDPDVGSRVRSWFGRNGGEAEAQAPERRVRRAAHTDHEVDRILEKISEQGFEALSEEERKTLYDASQR